ncbi:RNA polymerase sigma factor [Acidobacteriota bacterium]
MNWDNKRIKKFEELVDRFARQIEINIQLFDPQKNGIDPEDVSQEVKIKIWKILTDEKKIYSYPSYIKKIVNSCVIDQIRRSRREEGIISKEKLRRISDKKSLYKKSVTVNPDLKNVVGEAIDSLIETRQKVVRLFLLSMTLEEISIVLNWTQDKTRNLLYRGLNDLKKTLKEKGIDYEGHEDR